MPHPCYCVVICQLLNTAHKMRLFLVLLLVATVMVSESDAWRRVRWRRVARIAGTAVKVGSVLLGKRDVESLDANMDGTIDQSEAETIMDRRSAMELLSFADENGDTNVSLEEFARTIENIEE
ncbi:uncharacterized protein LOC124256974 [Haliotis rubra]|uniref:uncharacterized protein LOC124256973 n=1 Tax=Haliotis rubra TaxID=36100 RepID=UPI001EE581F1|nr:uncharacterized protein LOC124256973 [Haliotis rubra]XP_046546887.1 uncharacterized protein LOC124256974 [Haliotis rubra]